MFPIRDHTQSRSFPILNYTIIAITVFVFYLQLTAPDFEIFIKSYGFIPARFSLFNPATYLPVFYSIFLHGGFFHIIANLWFLHIFGDNVEDELGHFNYLFFYLICGTAAVMSQYIINSQSTLPIIGASGAISGVTGAYFVYFKKSRIEALVPLGFFLETVQLPAWFFIGYWFVIQVFSGIGSLSQLSSGGVAFFAHIGGFLAGYLFAKFAPFRKYNQLV